MGRQGAVIFGAMAILFVIGLTICVGAERAGNPVIGATGIDQDMGSMEGKEVRFGVDQSALFTTVTTLLPPVPSTICTIHSHRSAVWCRCFI